MTTKQPKTMTITADDIRLAKRNLTRETSSKWASVAFSEAFKSADCDEEYFRILDLYSEVAESLGHDITTEIAERIS